MVVLYTALGVMLLYMALVISTKLRKFRQSSAYFAVISVELNSYLSSSFSVFVAYYVFGCLSCYATHTKQSIKLFRLYTNIY